MKIHFLKEKNDVNNLRYVIYKLMCHFEDMYDVIGDVLNFKISKETAIDLIENNIIDMEKLYKKMSEYVSSIEKQDQMEFQKTSVYEAVRRTYNFLTGLNIIDLNKDNWVRITARCLIDKIYYRQIKSLVF